ncbi:MAG: sigma-70 family RNA polymerase sigma factor [Candidatus Hydrogenedentes bacterium]|nr:sigma-70 family RNA polymerase sigma factor [Candidatus Hydrogenedentota bacterium]
MAGTGKQDANLAAGESAQAERDWVARTRAGDTAAFAHLVERYSSRVYGHLFRLVRNRDEAEDLAQETFLRAFRFLGQYDEARPFRNWLYRIAMNAAFNALRTRRRRGYAAPVDVEEIPAGNPGLGNTGQEELRARLDAALARLPRRVALLIALHYEEGMTVREAAAVVNMSEGAAKVALCRARKALRRWLIEDEE